MRGLPLAERQTRLQESFRSSEFYRCVWPLCEKRDDDNDACLWKYAKRFEFEKATKPRNTIKELRTKEFLIP